MSVSFVIFTDLDATLLDHRTYSFEPSRPVLENIKKLQIPVVLCTSKTRAETEVLAQELGLKHPFIVENGGAVFMPENYFPTDYFKKLNLKTHKNKPYRVLELGTPYRRLRQFFNLVRKNTGLTLTGFGDLTVEEIASLTGLGKKEARLARQREYDEPFLLESSQTARWLGEAKTNREPQKTGRTASGGLEKNEATTRIDQEPLSTKQILSRLRREASRYGLRITAGGRFYHLTGRNDKGRAVRLLRKLYQLKFGSILTIGLGDSANDWPMLKAVDYPVLIARPDRSHSGLPPGLKNIYRTRKPGPQGWAEAMEYFLSRFGLPEDCIREFLRQKFAEKSPRLKSKMRKEHKFIKGGNHG
ncbi:MAG: HAD-IIB family hydrolase [Candidatus Saccharicenans sp.]|uniref:HAD-IIB family hydrolase n=1 Tax=Candidatus Saccharicenans sp. TaxID=2819258 RepID=UPI00404AC660